MKRLLTYIIILILIPVLVSCSKKEISTEVAADEINKVETGVEVSDDVVDDDKSTYELVQDMKMPNIKLETNKDTTFELNKTKKPVFINFWATWCPPCRIELPWIQSLYEEYNDRVDFLMISVGDTKETIEDFLVEEKVYTFPIAYDENATYAQKFGIVGIPTTLIISEDKILKFCVVGARDEDLYRGYIERILQK